MAHTLTMIDQVDPKGSYVVRRPRETDATGAVLRHAFGDDPTLPADMLALLKSLGDR